MDSGKLTVAAAQISPVLLDRDATLSKVMGAMDNAQNQGANLVAFGEGLLPGYPFWIALTDGARFDAQDQKEMHAVYLDQAVDIEAGHLNQVCDTAAKTNLSVVLGMIEKAPHRGGHTLYCSRAYIDGNGDVLSVHRKLMPTFEERLSWGIGDGHGLVVHPLGSFTVGALNCWENWMPLARASLYAQGEDLHVAIWPGNVRNTEDITRFIARESRSYVLSVSGLFDSHDVPDHVPLAQSLKTSEQMPIANGGSCLAGPDGEWIIEPIPSKEGVWVAEIDHELVRRERHNFDPSGHYSRPDVFTLQVDRRLQQIATFRDSD